MKKRKLLQKSSLAKLTFVRHDTKTWYEIRLDGFQIWNKSIDMFDIHKDVKTMGCNFGTLEYNLLCKIRNRDLAHKIYTYILLKWG